MNETDDLLAPKEDIFLLKQDVLDLRKHIAKKFDHLIIAIVSTQIAVVILLLAFLKL